MFVLLFPTEEHTMERVPGWDPLYNCPAVQDCAFFFTPPEAYEQKRTKMDSRIDWRGHGPISARPATKENQTATFSNILSLIGSML